MCPNGTHHAALQTGGDLGIGCRK